MKKQAPELLFVELKEPAAVRRDVLMGTKDILDCLKRYEEFKTLKAQKQEAVDKLNRIVSDLQSLNRRLRNKMPKPPVTIPSIRESAWEEEGAVEKVSKGTLPSAARPQSKLDILQEELNKIESRLAALD